MEALGIDVKLLIGQIVNFLILLFLLRYFLYGPVVKMLDERRKKIADSLENSKKIENRLLEVEENSKRIIEKSQSEAARIIDEAGKVATLEKNEIMQEAQTQGEKIIQSAKDEAAQIKTEITADVKKDIGSIVIVALEKIVGSELNQKQKEALVDKAVKNL